MRRKSWWLRHGGVGLVAVLATGVAIATGPSDDAAVLLQSASGGESTTLLDYVSFVPVATALLVAIAVRRYLRSHESVPWWLDRGWYVERVSLHPPEFVGRLAGKTRGKDRIESGSDDGAAGSGTPGTGAQRRDSGAAGSTRRKTGVSDQCSTSGATARSKSSTPVQPTSSTPVRSSGSTSPVRTASSGSTPVQTANSTPIQTTSTSTPVQRAGNTPVHTSRSSNTPVRTAGSTPVRTSNSPSDRGRGDEPVPDRLALVYGEQRILVTDGDTVDEKIRAILRWAGEEDYTKWIDDGHLRFVRDGHGFTLVAGGDNLTRLNGDRVPAGERARVYPGDEIELSGVVSLAVRRA